MALNTDSVRMVSVFQGKSLSQRLLRMGILDAMEAETLANAFAQGRYEDAHALLVQAQERDSER